MFVKTALLVLAFCRSIISVHAITDKFIAERLTESANYRLPTHVLPYHYVVSLQPNFTTFTFDGEVAIEANVVEESNNITLHVNELTIHEQNITVVRTPAIFLQVSNVTYERERHFVVLNFDYNLTVGSYLIYLPFEGILNDRNVGFYRASYVDGNGTTRWLATTQFGATHARQAFPCFDEPAFRAEFTIKIIRPLHYNSISNMELLSTENVGDFLEQDVFERSISIPTYLVAFVISEYISIEEGNQKVYARGELIEDGRGDYALETGTAIVNIMQEFTNSSYEFNKLDHVAIPNNWLTFEAKQNWGLLTYKDQYLLYKTNVSTSWEKQQITATISHKIAHQMFGNLVSPSWWNYIWINEALATHFGCQATSIFAPTWRTMEQFVVRSLQFALELDALETTRPLTTDVGHPDDVTELFNFITFQKAGSVMRMMEHFLTTEVFETGLQSFLIHKRFGVADAFDLWNSFQEAVNIYNISDVVLPFNESVETIMETWNRQSGYPVVHVGRDYINGGLILTQERFHLSNARTDEIWHIPINFATADDPDFTNTSTMFWLTQNSSYFETNVMADSWIIVNKQQTGYYRVNYDEYTWRLIISYLRSPDFVSIPPINRAQLIDDAYNLARSGRLTYRIVLELLEYVSHETDYIPLYSMTRGLISLDSFLLGTDHYDEFRNFIVEILQTAYQTLGTQVDETESVTDAVNRIAIVGWLCRYGDESCRQAMNAKLSEEAHIVLPDLQEMVYCGGMRNGNESNWLYLYHKYHSISTEELERNRILTGLGCALDEDLLKRTLESSLLINGMFELNLTNVTDAFAAVYAASDIGVSVAFSFVLGNFTDISQRLTVNEVSTILSGISIRLTHPTHLDRLIYHNETLGDELRNLHSEALATAYNNIQNNLLWYETNIDEISDWFHGRNTPELSTITIPMGDVETTLSSTSPSDDLPSTGAVTTTTTSAVTPTISTSTGSTEVTTGGTTATATTEPTTEVTAITLSSTTPSSGTILKLSVSLFLSLMGTIMTLRAT